MARKSRNLNALEPHDAAHRVSAYIYGNILVLAALIAIFPEQIADGHALVIVLGTGLTTYLAHCLAEQQEIHVLKGKKVERGVLKVAFRNSLPILSSTVYPVFLLALGYWGVVSVDTAWTLAVGLIGLRLLFNGVIVARYRQEEVTLRTMLSGIILAGLALSVALLKNHLTH